MTRTSSVVTLEVAKQGAIYHGLATLLNQPSPMMQRISDRRGSGKPRPKSEGFELYNNSAPNGSPESPQLPWAEYSEPKKLPGDDRLMKNRADHRSSPNVASKKGHCACPSLAWTCSVTVSVGGTPRACLVIKAVGLPAYPG